MSPFPSRFWTRCSLALAALALPLWVHAADGFDDHDRGGCDAGFHGPPGKSMGMDHGPMGMGHVPGMGPPGMGPGEDRWPPFLHGVKLTEDQDDKIFAITHAAAPALRDQFKAVRKSSEALRELGRSSQFSVDTATSLAQARGKAESQLSLLRVRMEHDVYAVLTAEQRTQIGDRERDMDAHHGGSPR